MNQEINFYRSGTRPSKCVLGVEWMVWAIAVLMLLLICMSAMQVMSNQRLRAHVVAAEQRATGLETRLNELRLSHPEPKPDPGLVAEIEHMRRMADDLNRLMQTVDTDDMAQRVGFSAYFVALARQRQIQLWLTGIQLKKGGAEIELAGSAVVSESIPRLVESLGLQAAFRGKTFSDLELRRPQEQQGQIDFVLRTRVPETEK